MPIKFDPNYQLNLAITQALLRIEAARAEVSHLPVTPKVLASLRQTAMLSTTHYSTVIEGNRLTQQQVSEVLVDDQTIRGRERDEFEVKGYYAALHFLETQALRQQSITERTIQLLHGLVMGGGRTKVAPSPYRTKQNMIKEAGSGLLVYLPPEAKDVPELMQALVSWLKRNRQLPPAILAGVCHYQFATIHPYYDGNGRTARLLASLVLHLNGYGLKGLYSLEEYYAKNLEGYYRAISIGPSHNYYEGREQADITQWLEYFCLGVATAFENVVKHMQVAQKHGAPDHSELLRTLDAKQRRALELFKEFEVVTSAQIAAMFGFQARTSSALCKAWREAGFLRMIDPSNKARKYTLADKYQVLLGD